MRCRGERGDREPHLLPTAAYGRAQARFPRLAFAQLQQALAELNPRHRIPRAQVQRLLVETDRGGVFAVQGPDLGQRDDSIVPLWLRGAHLHEQAARFSAVVAFEVKIPQPHLQHGGVLGEREFGFEDRNSFVKVSGGGQLVPKFEKGQDERRSPRRRQAQLIDRLMTPSGGGQRPREQGLDRRVVAPSRRRLQRIDRVGRAASLQERMPQHLRRHDIVRARRQHLAGETLRLIEALGSERKQRLFERLADLARRFAG